MKKNIKTILFILILLTAGFTYSCGQVKYGKTNNPAVTDADSLQESPGSAGFSSGTMTEIEAPDPGNGMATKEKAVKTGNEKNVKEAVSPKQTDTAPAKKTEMDSGKTETEPEKSAPVSPAEESAGTEETGAASASDAEEKAAHADPPPASAETEKRSSLVNINTASREELMKLKGVGEVKALRILEYRKSHGGFKSIEEIMKVRGIKDGSFQKIRDSITV